MVRSIEIGKLGITNPSGLAFSPDANKFIVADLQRDRQFGDKSTRLATIKLFEEELASPITLPGILSDPVNMAFEKKTQSLYIFDQTAHEMLQIRTGPAGELDSFTQGVTHFDLLQLDLTSAQGIAFDPQTGDLFVLDTARTQIARLVPDSGNQYDSESAARDERIGRINLNRFGPGELRGLAFDAGNNHLYVLSDFKQQLYELSETGQVISVWDLSELHLLDPQGMVFAPSGDPTDDPSSMNLYILDRGSLNSTSQTPPNGQIVEVSLALPARTALLQSKPTSLVNTIRTSLWSPNSPDPAGIAYLPDSKRLLITDSEVDEMSQYFTGKNVYISTRSGGLAATCTTLPFSYEPAGAAVNPVNHHIFFADDDTSQVFEVNLGADGEYCTADDTVTYISTGAFNSYDPEGAAYGQGKLFISDGVGQEVYVVSPGANGIFDGVPPAGDDKVTHFDTSALNLLDPEGIEYNPDNNTLFIVSTYFSDRAIIETTLTGALVNSYDISFLGDVPRSGLAYGAGSQKPGVKHIYMASRGVDNDQDPNENDGKIFEIALGSSTAPSNPTRTPTPAAPNDLTTTSISRTQIDLAWTDNSDNESGFRIERSPNGTTGWGQIATVGANVTTYSNTGLTCSTTYYYRVRAYNAHGYSGYSNTANATTVVCTPASPSNLTALSVSQTRINLAWTDNSTNESGFKIGRSRNGTSDWVQIAIVGANVINYADTSLAPRVTYYYRVRAYNAGGNSAYSNIASAKTKPSPVYLPLITR